MDKKMTSVEIVDFLKENEGWILQHCSGIRDDGWWWLRNEADTTKTIKVNGNSASSAAKKLKRRIKADFRHVDYSIN